MGEKEPGGFGVQQMDIAFTSEKSTQCCSLLNLYYFERPEGGNSSIYKKRSDCIEICENINFSGNLYPQETFS